MTARRTARQAGFTIIEVLIVIMVMGILLSLAVPSFRSFVIGQRVKTASFDFYAALVFARSEAMKRRQSVTVAPVTSGEWTSGWTVKQGTTTLRSQDPVSGVSISSGSATNIVYRADGRITSASNVGVLISPNPADASLSNRCIRVDLAGMPRSIATTTTTCP
ncbi:MAG TPA: GspH/FimT family pseudopilin [Burkholderiales bacterium]|jgi:type IV fimbrial biogenesis protein FimT